MSVATTTTAPVPWETIESYTAGDVSGQQIVGHHNVQVGSIHGSVVNITMPEQRVAPRLRATVLRAPRPFPGLVGREAEVGAALSALTDGIPVNAHGEAGCGKSALISHLAHHPDAPDLRRVVHCPAQRRPLADLLQYLFDAFYESNVSFVPSFGQVSGYLHDVSGFALLDDVELDRDDAQTLLNTAPNCAFVLASQECCVWDEGGAVPLGGLAEEAALALVERRLARSLSAGERRDSLRLCHAVGGHPLRLVQAVALVRKGQRSLGELAAEAAAASAPEVIAEEVARPLDDRQRAVLAVLGVLTDAPVHADHIAALTGVSDALSMLQALRDDAVVKAYSPSFSLTAPLAPSLEAGIDRRAWATRTADYFSSLAERHRRDPARLAGDADAVLAALQLAADHGRARDVVRLGRAAEPLLALGRRPGGWETAMRRVLHAARSVADRAGEAWAHHQLGIRALCVHDLAPAREHLERALELRRSLGDHRGATVTRYHLDALRGLPPPPPNGPVPLRPAPPAPRPTPGPFQASPSGPDRPPWYTVVAILSAAAIVFVVGVVTALVRRGPSSDSRVVSFEAGGVTISVEFEPTAVGFGSEPVGATSPARAVSVRNVGDAPVSLGRVSLVGTGAPAFTITADGCGTTTVDPGESCQVSVAFAPLTAGGANGALALMASTTMFEVPLSGVGVAPAGPRVTVAPETPTTLFDPGVVPTTAPTGPTPGGGGGGVFVNPPRPSPNRAQAAPVPEVDPTAIEWERVMFSTQGPLQSATVRNRGAAPFTVETESMEGPQASAFDQEDSCEGETLGPGDTCQISFYFRPTDPFRTNYNATFELVTDGGVVLRVELHGTSFAVSA